MANISYGVNIIPKTNNAYTLGNSDYKWSNIYAVQINGTNVSDLGTVQDVQINENSILSNGTANIPIASNDTYGVVKVNQNDGISLTAQNTLTLNRASPDDAKVASNAYKVCVAYWQHYYAFYGLAKAAGDSTQSASSNAVGIYTDNAKSAIQNMLQVSSSNNPIFTGAFSQNRKSNTTIGTNSFSSGDNCEASAEDSHAEGRYTVASGYYSHAEGNYTTASGMASHAAGTVTVANHASQYAFGEYNVEDSSSADVFSRGNYVEIVGNGTASNALSNARALDWSGNEYLKGDLYVGCNANSTSGTKIVSTAFEGATSSAAGSKGYVPAPSAGDDEKFLMGDGTWSETQGDAFAKANDLDCVLSDKVNAIKSPYTIEDVIPSAMIFNNGTVVEGSYNNFVSPLISVTAGTYGLKVIHGSNVSAVGNINTGNNGNNGFGFFAADGETVVTRPSLIQSLGNDIYLIEVPVSAAYIRFGITTNYADYTSQTLEFFNQWIFLPNADNSITDDFFVLAQKKADGVIDKLYRADGSRLTIKTMTGATSSTAGTSGFVPAPTTGDVDKFLAGDGTYKNGGLPMVILSYGNSTWADFEAAYNNNVIVYCRASSNSNPKTGSQTRMAFMAYVNDASTPTNVEFQYYRSLNSHSASAMGDEVYVYKLDKTNGWSVTTRPASIKTISGNGIGVSWSNNTITLTNQADLRPWEKINEETFTNATEGDHEITVDLNNTAFSLTDVILMFETPVQETDAAKGAYGQVKFYYDSNNCFTSESGAWTQAASASAHGFVVRITQEPGGLFWCQETQSATSSNSGAWRTRYSASFDTDTQGLRFLANNYVRQISRIVITKVTGTGHYKLYGKRATT